MKRLRRRAFTLIELLIVIAIISVLAAGLIGYITIPPAEQASATASLEAGRGLGLFFAKLTADAHNAAALLPLRGGNGFVLADCSPAGSAAYYVDAQGGLKRAWLGSSGARELAGAADSAWRATLPAGRLADRVTRLAVEPLAAPRAKQGAPPGGRLWRVTASVALRDPLRPVLERSLDAGVGLVNTGGASAALMEGGAE